MLQATFTITWPDGKRAVAEIEAESPEQNYPVDYAGTFTRLLTPPKRSDVALLAAAMRRSADQTGGRYSEHYAGRYDRADGRPGF
jgi:hypothetical protein